VGAAGGRRRSGLQEALKTLAKISALFALLIGADLAAGALLKEFPTAARPNRESWEAGFFDEYQRTSRTFAPYVGWKSSDFQGRYINISGGLRKTLPPSLPPRLKVAFFGGSTAWGYGARDEHTIPSELARLHPDWQVTNRGQLAYVSWQNAIDLAERCAAGDVPNLVIFYNGANEVRAATEVPGGERPLVQMSAWSRWHEANRSARHLFRFLAERAAQQYERHSFVLMSLASRRQMKPLTADVARAAGTRAATEHLQTIRFVRQLGRVYGFRTLAVWQPVVQNKRRRTAEEQEFVVPNPRNDYWLPAFASARAVYSSDVELLDLADVFGDSAEHYFIDGVHVNEAGNRVIAQAIDHRLSLP
jgi:lysophospholipase L1-like esterase